MVLVSIPGCLLFLTILVSSGPYLTLSSLIIICIYILPTIRHVQQLIQHGDYAFFIDLLDAYWHISIIKYHHHFLKRLVWCNMPYWWKVLPFGLATAPRVFMALTKPILFLCHCKGFQGIKLLPTLCGGQGSVLALQGCRAAT